MSERPPIERITDETISQIRQHVTSLERNQGCTVPHTTLISLANATNQATILTVDLPDLPTTTDVNRETPLVILRPAQRLVNPRLELLSPRERTVATLIANGLANKQIAGRLQLSLATVKDHVHNILEKTGLPKRAAVAALFSCSDSL